MPEMSRSETSPDAVGHWQAALAQADTDLLDCLAVNVAVLLAWHGDADVRTPFAARWLFRLRGKGTRDSRPDLPPQDLADDLRELAGWELQWQSAAELAGELPAWSTTCHGGQPVLVVADAFDMPWVPYCGHEHMEHSFIIAGVGDRDLTVVDGYTNTTEWGAAQPVTSTVGRPEIAGLLAGPGRWSVVGPAGSSPAPNPARLVQDNAEQIRSAGQAGCYEAFLSHAATLVQAGDLAPVALDTWLLARSRGLHARWLDSEAAAWVPAPTRRDFSATVTAAWTRAAEMSYIGLRRARSGRGVPPAVTECLRVACSAEQELANVLCHDFRSAAVAGRRRTAPGGAPQC